MEICNARGTVGGGNRWRYLARGGAGFKDGLAYAQTAQASEPVLFDEHARTPGKMAPAEPQRGTRVAHPGRNASGVLPPPPPYPPQTAYPPQPAYPPQSVMEACNRYANEQVSSKAENVLKNAALGAAIGAAVGAAGGAIAAGGSGAGKGAAIGGVTGVAGGTLYGLNEGKSRDAQYQGAYASCMHSKGY